MFRQALSATAFVILVAAPASAQETCFVVSDQSTPDLLVRIDRATGVQTSVGGMIDTTDASNLTVVEAIAVDGRNGTLYATHGGELGTVNRATGAFTPVGQAGNADGVDGVVAITDLDGLTIDPQQGIMWACHRRGGNNSDLLVQLDFNTGAVIPGVFNGEDYVVIEDIGNRRDCDDLAWSPVDNQLFVMMNNGGGNDRVAILNTTDGSTTDFGQDVGIADIEGMGFGLDGTLFGTTGGFDGSGVMLEISTTTGVGTARFDLDDIPGAGDYESIDCSVNQAPTADDDAAVTDEDNAVNIDVLDGDIDNDNHALANPTVTVAPNFGSTQVEANGTITYTPNANANGTDTFTYQVCDPFNACDTATVTVVVTPVPDDPIAADDAATTDEDNAVTINVRANDQEPDGEPLSAPSITAGPSNGTAAVNGAGDVVYTPNAEFSGSDSFTYEVCDPGNACDTATVNVTVVEVNDPPVAQDDSARTNVGERVTVDVRANDSDPEGGALENPTIVNGPANGQAQVQPDGQIGYSPNAGFAGTDTLTYQVCDAQNACATATLTITVVPPNAPPDAVDDAVVLDEDASANFDPRANDSDPDGDPLQAPSIETAPSNGQAVVNADGTITYTPDADFFGVDTLTYQVCDDQNNCASATATFTVAGIDDDPSAGDDAATVVQDGTVVIDVRGNDVDVDGDVLEAPSIDTPPTLGTATVLGDGTVQYEAGATPGTDTFVYEVCDGTGRCDTATVTVTIVDDQTPVPVADTATLNEDESVVVDVLANDNDPNGDPLTASIDGAPSNGSAVVLGDGTVRYTPNPDFNGEDTFTYEVCDDEDNCATARATVTVNPVNDAPVAVDDVASTEEDTAVELDVLANDSDADGDNLVPSIADAPSNGTAAVLPGGSVRYTPNTGFIGEDAFVVEVCDPSGACDRSTVTVSVGLDGAPLAGDDIATAQEDGETSINVLANDQDPEGDPLTVTAADPANGEVFVQPDGTVVYRPDPDFFGTDAFTYEVCDPTPRCDTATVTVSVTPVNDAPRVQDDGAVTDANTPVSVAVLDNDVEVDGEALTVSVGDPPANGTAIVQPGGAVLYTPDVGFTGDDTFTYEACDESGLCASATVTVRVGVDSAPPSALDDEVSTDEDTEVLVDVRANDIDPDGDPLQNPRITTAPGLGTARVRGDGTVSYTPRADVFGTDTFTYEVCDSVGLCASATVVVSIAPVDDAPNAVDDNVTTPVDAAITIDVTANDVEPDGEDLTVDLGEGAPQNGTVSVDGDNIVYTPNAGFAGRDAFTYEVCDPQDNCASATVNVAVGDNGAPSATDESATVDEDATVNISVLDGDVDPDGDPLILADVSDPPNGTATLNGDGTVTYAPDPNFAGTDTFTYTVCDDGPACTSATVTVTVNPIDDAPIAVDDAASATPGQTLAIDVLANDLEVDGEELTISQIVDAAGQGTATIEDGAITYVTNDDGAGVDTFTYEVCDPQNNCATATVRVSIGDDDNVAPVANDDTAETPPGTAVLIDVRANDTDEDPSALRIVELQQPARGDARVEDGQVRYTPDPGFTGEDTFEYEVCDAQGACDRATVTVTVDDPNEAPVARDDTAVTDTDTVVTALPLLNDTDPDHDDAELTVTIVTPPPSGTAEVVEQGGVDAIRYTPADEGPNELTYEVCDPRGLCDVSTVLILVSGPTDRDGDGIPDEEEEDGGSDPDDPDTDDDGLIDGHEPQPYVDTDGDGLANVLDPDSDNDFLGDGTESGIEAVGPGTDLGAGNFTPDGDDGATTTDPLDPDTDDGGVKDGLEDFDGDGVVDDGEMDPNNTPDDENLNDTDGDGIDDAHEPLLGSDPNDADSDDDGIADGDEPNGANDTDGDGERNLTDPDSDGDGLQDGTESGVTVGTVDTDPDVFIPDADPDTTTSPLDPDTDDGGVSDGDEDTNRNGRVDEGERDPNDPADDNDPGDDEDGDLIVDAVDNCPSDPNPDQADLDGDNIGDVCDPTTDLGVFGGGALTDCSSTDVNTELPIASLALLLLGGALFGRRKKAALSIVLAALALSAVPAAAQEELTNFPAERFRAAMDKEGIVDVEWGRVTPHLSYDLGVIGWYAHNPMLLYRKEGDRAVERVQTLVGSRVGLSLVGQVGLFDIVELGLALPVVAFQSRPDADPSKPGAALIQGGIQPAGIGDLRVSPKIAVLNSDDHLIDLAVIPSLTLPTAGLLNGAFGNDVDYMGDSFLTFAPELVISRAFDSGLRLSGNLGYRFRPEAATLDLVVGNEVFYRGGVAFRFHEAADLPLELGASLGGQSTSFDPFAGANRNPLELLAELKYDITPEVTGLVGGGAGVIAGYSTPDFRVLAGLRFAPRPDGESGPLDTDGDGLLDPDDRCPELPEDRDGFEDEEGCPDPDNDGDAILDADDRCPMEPEDVDTYQDDDGCPDPDNDGDGVRDSDDKCPLEPGVPEADGCPADDRDQDGIKNAQDICPDDAEDKDNFQDDDGCPDEDNDDDGILDVSDKCPLSPEDKDGFEDEDGCPDIDNDKDGFKDADDKCPMEPETINGNKDDDGCPDEGKTKVIIRKGRIDILEKVFFNTNSAVIQRRSYNLLQQVASVLRTNPKITKVRIEGHTDSRGSDAYNLDLSDRRAKSVRAYLVKAGIEPNRMVASGFGEVQPIATNDTPDGREQNRRVEFKIVEMDGKAVDATTEVKGETEVIEVDE